MRSMISVSLYLCLSAPILNAQVPLGIAGLPIGTYITVEGTPRQSKYYNFEVDVINGKKLNETRYLAVESKLELPWKNGERYVLKGYETMQMIGSPPALAEAAKEMGQPVPPLTSAGWQVYYTFVTLRVIPPSEK